MNIVIPMAGRGTRLAGHESGKPKPLIEFQGRPLWWWATSCLPLDQSTRLVFVCLREHVDTFGVDASLREAYRELPLEVVVLDEVTDGQLRTVVEAKEAFSLSSPLLVFNADTWFRHDSGAFLKTASRSDGVLGVAEKPGDQWSFTRLNPEGDVVEVAEKRRISDWACTGLYFFRNLETFLEDAYSALAADPKLPEHYVAPLYNRMIERGETISIDIAEEAYGVGTPTEADEFARFLESQKPGQQ